MGPRRASQADGAAWVKAHKWEVAGGLCPAVCRQHHSQVGSDAARRKAGAEGQGWLRQLCQEL